VNAREPSGGTYANWLVGRSGSPGPISLVQSENRIDVRHTVMKLTRRRMNGRIYEISYCMNCWIDQGERHHC
jgi:hypothetical protein